MHMSDGLVILNRIPFTYDKSGLLYMIIIYLFNKSEKDNRLL
jgi:hypothetical protein